MALKRAIATPPGADTLYEDLSPAEEAAHLTESATNRNRDTCTRLGSAFIREGERRASVHVPEWNSGPILQALVGAFPALNKPNSKMSKARDLWLYARDTAPAAIAALTTQAELDAVDPTSADPFSDGAGWPE